MLWSLRVRFRPSQGQGLAEYALILGLVAVVVIGALTFLGGSINDMLGLLSGAL